MSWRTVVLSKRAKIEYSLGYMVIRGEEVHRIFMEEVETVMIETTAVSLTAAWINECLHRKSKLFSAMKEEIRQERYFLIEGAMIPAGRSVPS